MAGREPGARSASVKDVAAARRRLPRHRLQRAEPARPGQPGHPRAGAAGDGRARLRAQRVRPPAAGRHQPHPGLRDARRQQPVLHRRRPGHRGRGRGRRAVAGALQQRQPRRPRAVPPRTCSSSSGSRASWSPRSTPSPPTLDELARRGTPVVRRRPAPRRPVASARSRSTTCSAAGSRSSTSSTGATPGSRSSAARPTSARSATGSRAPATPGTPPACPPRTWSSSTTSALTVAEGREAGQRLAGMPAAAPADRGVLRQRPGRARPAPAGDRRRHPGARGPGDRRVRRHRVRRGRRRTPHLGAPAPPGARPRPPPSWSSTRRRNPDAHAPAGAVHPRAGRPGLDAGLGRPFWPSRASSSACDGKAGGRRGPSTTQRSQRA